MATEMKSISVDKSIVHEFLEMLKGTIEDSERVSDFNVDVNSHIDRCSIGSLVHNKFSGWQTIKIEIRLFRKCLD